MPPAPRPSGNPFGVYIRRRLQRPGLDCEVCRTAFERGNLANDAGQTVYDGADPDEYQCSDCPLRLSGPLDATSGRAIQCWNLLASVPEGSASVEFVFQVVGIAYPSQEATEIVHRIGLIARISHELETNKAKPGQPPGTVDFLEGLVDDDDEE